MENVQTRNLKVYNQGQGYRGNVPTIILKGDWLKKFGFDCTFSIFIYLLIISYILFHE